MARIGTEAVSTKPKTKPKSKRGIESDRFYMSHTEIAEQLGISRQRVEQLEKSAIRKILATLDRPYIPRHERLGKAMPK